MEVSAVALLGIAGIEHVAVSPARAALVIFHDGDSVVVNGASLVERLCLAFGYFDGEVGRQAGDGDKRVGLQVFLPFLDREGSHNQVRRGVQRRALMAHHVVFHVKMQFGLSRGASRDETTQSLRSIGGFLICSQLRTENWKLRTGWETTHGRLRGNAVK